MCQLKGRKRKDKRDGNFLFYIDQGTCRKQKSISFFSLMLIIKSNARGDAKLEREGKVRLEQCHAYDAKTKKERKREKEEREQ